MSRNYIMMQGANGVNFINTREIYYPLLHGGEGKKKKVTERKGSGRIVPLLLAALCSSGYLWKR